METQAMKERLQAVLYQLQDIEATTPYRLVIGRQRGDWMFITQPITSESDGRDERHPASAPFKRG
jgi:hypothetical protein